MTGKAIIFSAPSGAGKTTLVKAMLEHFKELSFSISACSRDQRQGEVDAKDYYFLGVEGFKSEIEKDHFFEWEEVYPDQFYGTLNRELERIWALGNVVIFDVDVVGALNIKEKLGANALSVFVQPPNEEALEKRLRYRQTETEEKIQLRLSKAREELSYAVRFDTIIVNDDLETAIQESKSTITNFIAE